MLQILARIYSKSQFAKRDAAGEFSLGYEEFLRRAGVADGDQRESAELEIARYVKESAGMFCVDRHRRSGLPLKIRLHKNGGEEWLFNALGMPTPRQSRQLLVEFFQQASREQGRGEQASWQHYFEDLARRAQSGESVQPFSRDDMTGNQELLHAVAGVLQWRGPSLMRYASTKIFGDSKRLQQLAARVRTVLEAVTGVGDLEHYGILRKPRMLTMHGPIQFTISGKNLDLTELPAPIALSELTFAGACEVRSANKLCVTVENEDTFHEMAASNPGVMLILTSYASSALIRLLQLLPQEVKFFHFGDDDAEGVDIQRDLIVRSGRSIEALAIPRSQGEVLRPFDQREQRLLQAAMCESMPASLRNKAEELLASGLRADYEQEHITIEDVWKSLAAISTI